MYEIIKCKYSYSLKPLWSDLVEAPIPNINEFSQLFSRQAVEPKVAKKKMPQKKKTEVSLYSLKYIFNKFYLII